MTNSYNGRRFDIKIGTDVINQNRDAILTFPNGGWQNILLIGPPRSFKSSHAKQIALLVSRIRKVVIFSLNNEWEEHITNYNYYAAYPLKLDCKILKDFCVKISDFKDPNDFISLGFTSDSCAILNILINKGFPQFRDDIQAFARMLADLPTKERDKSHDYLQEWVDKYGEELRLDMPVNYMVKQSLINHFLFIKDWFWTGPNDSRPYYDFAKEIKNNDHTIISIGSQTNKARSFCGLVLKQLRDHHTEIRAFFVFEEMRTLAPSLPPETPDFLIPSSCKEIYDLMTLLPKYGCAMLGITQSEEMIFQKLREHFFTRIIGPGVIGRGPSYDLAFNLHLRWDIHANNGRGYRELLIYYKTGVWQKYIPDWTQCKC